MKTARRRMANASRGLRVRVVVDGGDDEARERLMAAIAIIVQKHQDNFPLLQPSGKRKRPCGCGG